MKPLAEGATSTQPCGPAAPQIYVVTGGAGFIGSHLVEFLLAAGHRVRVIDDLSTGRVGNLAAVWDHPSFEFTEAAIFDDQALDRLCLGVDVVIHLAATVGVKLVVQQPVRTIDTNVRGTECVLRAALRHRCRVLLASTSEVYGKGSRTPFREEDDVLLGPTEKTRWCYAASKMLDEFLALAYWQESALPVVIFRLFNTAGPRQSSRQGMVIPQFVERALTGRPISVHGDGRQRRCFCDVRDAAEAISALARHPGAVGRVFNIGSSEEVSMIDLARRVKVLTQSPSPIVNIPYRKVFGPGFEDMTRRVPDTHRLHSLLGWRPRRKLDDILVDVIANEKAKRARAQITTEYNGSPPAKIAPVRAVAAR